MKILVDTHILIWFSVGGRKISENVRCMLESLNNEIYYSTASIWEIEIKYMSNPDKVKISGMDLADKCIDLGFEELNINSRHVEYLKTLKRMKNTKPHNDPFDRIMLAQAKAEGMLFITHDARIVEYEESCILYV